MASLSPSAQTISPTASYQNPPELIDRLAAEMRAHQVKPEIEVFDLSHLFKATEMVREAKLAAAPYVQLGEERHAGRPRGVRFLCRDVPAPAARRPGRIGWNSINGASWPADMCEPGWRIMCGSTDSRWRHRMPRWWSAPLRCAPATAAARQHRLRRGRCWGSLPWVKSFGGPRSHRGRHIQTEAGRCRASNFAPVDKAVAYQPASKQPGFIPGDSCWVITALGWSSFVEPRKRDADASMASPTQPPRKISSPN